MENSEVVNFSVKGNVVKLSIKPSLFTVSYCNLIQHAVLNHISEVREIDSKKLQDDLFPLIPEKICEKYLKRLCDKNLLNRSQVDDKYYLGYQYKYDNALLLTQEKEKKENTFKCYLQLTVFSIQEANFIIGAKPTRDFLFCNRKIKLSRQTVIDSNRPNVLYYIDEINFPNNYNDISCLREFSFSFNVYNDRIEILGRDNKKMGVKYIKMNEALPNQEIEMLKKGFWLLELSLSELIDISAIGLINSKFAPSIKIDGHSIKFISSTLKPHPIDFNNAKRLFKQFCELYNNGTNISNVKMEDEFYQKYSKDWVFNQNEIFE